MSSFLLTTQQLFLRMAASLFPLQSLLKIYPLLEVHAPLLPRVNRLEHRLHFPTSMAVENQAQTHLARMEIILGTQILSVPLLLTQSTWMPYLWKNLAMSPILILCKNNRDEVPLAVKRHFLLRNRAPNRLCLVRALRSNSRSSSSSNNNNNKPNNSSKLS